MELTALSPEDVHTIYEFLLDRHYVRAVDRMRLSCRHFKVLSKTQTERAWLNIQGGCVISQNVLHHDREEHHQIKLGEAEDTKYIFFPNVSGRKVLVSECVGQDPVTFTYRSVLKIATAYGWESITVRCAAVRALSMCAGQSIHYKS